MDDTILRRKLLEVKHSLQHSPVVIHVRSYQAIKFVYSVVENDECSTSEQCHTF